MENEKFDYEAFSKRLIEDIRIGKSLNGPPSRSGIAFAHRIGTADS